MLGYSKGEEGGNVEGGGEERKCVFGRECVCLLRPFGLLSLAVLLGFGELWKSVEGFRGGKEERMDTEVGEKAETQ